MAKFRRARRFKRRPMRRRKSFRKKSGAKYDGMIKVKMQNSVEIRVDASDNFIHTVVWGDIALATATNFSTIIDCQEWDRYTKLYQQYSIRGVKMRYLPHNFNGGTTRVV